MPAVQRFEDLRVWREARRLAADVDEACQRIRGARNFGLADQMCRAAISIVSNIAEGFERQTPRSFRYFLTVAKGSTAELRSQLYLCSDRNYLDASTVTALQRRAHNVSQMLRGLMDYLQQQGLDNPGSSRGTRNAERGTNSP